MEKHSTIVDLGRRAIDSVDAQRKPVATTLENTASALHEHTDRVAGMAHATADGMRATADYVRENDLAGMSGSVGKFVGRYPAQCMIAAAVAGFYVARVIRK
jgi:ElaB/YqjD/DUF883 family membrane-anchored ribosome-binding protein